MHPYFFGYGSLVNRETHTYPDARPARLKGWRRSWIRTAKREVVFLSVTPDADTVIDGLIASVPDADGTRQKGDPAGASLSSAGILPVPAWKTT